MEKAKLEKLLQRYLEGAATLKEREFIESWLKGREDEKRGGIVPGEAEDSMWREIQLRLNPVDKQLVHRRLHWLRTAAAVVLLAGGGLTTLHWFSPSKEPTHVQVERPFHVVRTPPGRKGKVFLADGSTVWLNAGTVIRYRQTESQQERQVYLDEGEAYFEVSHDPSRPFIVTTDAVQHRVLGTSFNIDLMSAPHEQVLAVVTGRVEVTHQSGGLTKVDTVVSGRQFSYSIDKFQGRITTSTIDQGAWKDGVLVFRNASWEELSKKLSRWYDVRVVLPDKSLRHHRFTASFENASLERVLESLKQINPFSYQLSEKEVVITP